MIYVYENARGDRREITAPMSLAPPQTVVINKKGDWRPKSRGRGKYPLKRIFTRVYSTPPAMIVKRKPARMIVATGGGRDIKRATGGA